MKCPNCGAMNYGTEAICSSCGHRIRSPARCHIAEAARRISNFLLATAAGLVLLVGMCTMSSIVSGAVLGWPVGLAVLAALILLSAGYVAIARSL